MIDGGAAEGRRWGARHGPRFALPEVPSAVDRSAEAVEDTTEHPAAALESERRSPLHDRIRGTYASNLAQRYQYSLGIGETVDLGEKGISVAPLNLDGVTYSRARQPCADGHSRERSHAPLDGHGGRGTES